MSIRLCTYNIEYFNDLFKKDNTLETAAKKKKRLKAIKKVLETIKADLIGIVEAPNTLKSGIKSTVTCLENFAAWAKLPTSKAMMGYSSVGDQEIAVLFNPAKVTVAHAPGGKANSKSNPRFDKEFRFDTDEDRVKEVYRFYRPPLEVKVKVKGQQGQSFKLMVVHPKSKGIFNSMDYTHWESECKRNRRKLFAECTWIRKRVDDWLDDEEEVVVMGDINDGPGMDYYELQFGRSAVEIVMGDLFSPDRILWSHAGRPEWGRYGWKPSSARFKDRFTEDYVNVLIDHILISGGIHKGAKGHKIWNPYEVAAAEIISKQLKEASDHFPVTIDIF
jgi:endonuclease/exonuclease/phosphatase family metal-dependent hydrolase